MKQTLKRAVFGLLGKDPEAIVISFFSGERELALAMLDEIRTLEPNRRHFVVSLGDPGELPAGVTAVPLEPAPAFELYGQLRRAFRNYRVGLAPVLFTDAPFGDLRRAAACFAPTRILAYNANLERHHLRLSNWIAALLFLRGVPEDRIFLRPWFFGPLRTDRSCEPRGGDFGHCDGRPFNPKNRRIAIVTPYYPYPMSHGGAVRIYNLLREISREFDIILLSFAEKVRGEHLPPVQQFCSKIYVVPAPRYREPRWSTLNPPEVNEFKVGLMRTLIDRVRTEFKAELVQVEYTMMASYRGDILVEHDVTFDLYQQLHNAAPSRRTAFDLWRWRRYERKAVKRFRRVLVMSDKDAQLLGRPNVRVIPNGVDLKRFQPQPETPGHRLLFVGSFRHFPNVQAFEFFVDSVWPAVSRQFPEATLTVVAGPDPLVYWKLHTGRPAPPNDPRIEILGLTRDVKPLLAKANVVLTPTLVSAGTNLKVIEAMAMERAVVSTSCGAAGLGLEHGRDIWIADGAEAFAEGVAALLGNPELRLELARNARRLAEQKYGWQVIGERYRELVRELLPQRWVIRPAGKGDLEAMARIQGAAPSASQWEPERYLAYDARVALAEGKVVAFIVTRRTAPDESEVLNLAVDPAVRRLGIATELMRDAVRRLPGEMFLEVRESNSPARYLYQKLGFQDAGLRQSYYENPPEAAIVMRLITC